MRCRARIRGPGASQQAALAMAVESPLFCLEKALLELRMRLGTRERASGGIANAGAVCCSASRSVTAANRLVVFSGLLPPFEGGGAPATRRLSAPADARRAASCHLCAASEGFVGEEEDG